MIEAAPGAGHPPHHVIPPSPLGCTIRWRVDLRGPEGRREGWDPNSPCERHRPSVGIPPLTEWLTDRLEGNRTFLQTAGIPHRPDC